MTAAPATESGQVRVQRRDRPGQVDTFHSARPLREFTSHLSCLALTLLIASASPRPPVTVEVKRDVEVVRGGAGAAQRGKLDAFRPVDLEPFWLRKAQRFQMIKLLGEGECRIRFKRKEYDLSSCPWLEGFADHQADIFAVVPTRKPAKRKPQ